MIMLPKEVCSMLNEQQVKSEIKATLSACFESREKLITLQNANPDIYSAETTNQAILRGKLGGLLIALGTDQNTISNIVSSLWWVGLSNEAPNVEVFMNY
jgi:hypothetical protein